MLAAHACESFAWCMTNLTIITAMLFETFRVFNEVQGNVCLQCVARGGFRRRQHRLLPRASHKHVLIDTTGITVGKGKILILGF
jgi:hypothetical protein